jgi:hypothetical protein
MILCEIYFRLTNKKCIKKFFAKILTQAHDTYG